MSKSLPPSATAITSGLRRYLYISAAITGAAILIVEILGAKMLSPYVGTSHFVWTAQIAITLVSLAVGYYFGGWLVDRSTRLNRLYFCIAIAAAYLCFAVVICEPVAYKFLELNLAMGALVASAVLFFIPLTLLAAVGPFLVRVLALSFNVIGGQVGRLSALSTLGSVFGTVLIGYVLTPLLPNSVTMFMTAGLLFAICAIYFLVWNRKQIAPIAAVLLGGLAIGAVGVRLDLHTPMPNVEELYRRNSNFGMLQVVQGKNSPRRFYLNDYLVQNVYDPETRKSLTLFTYMLRYLAEGYREEIDDVLCIGLGVGIVPMEMARDGASVDAVEINPGVVEVGTRFFDLDPRRFKLTIGDGRYFVNQSKRHYDVIVLDAFLGDSSPSHLMTREAFDSMKRILKPGGVLVINSFGDFRPCKNFFVSSLDKTLRAVFSSVKIHATGNGNVFFAASTQTNMVMREISTADTHPSIKSEVESCLRSQPTADPAVGRILTDDFNPVEYHDAENREHHRRRLAMNLRRL